MALQFTYNGYTAQIINKHTMNLRDGELTFAADLLVAGDSDANFKAACDAAEDKLTENNRAFTITLGAQTLVSWDPAANSGFLQKVSLRKAGNVADTARSRIYRFEIEAQREPQVAARAGRREAEIMIEEPAPDTMRRLRFRGVWTALVNSGTPKDARTAYAANVQAWVDTWLTAILTPTSNRFWQRLGQPSTNWEDENKILHFDVAYEETHFTATPKQGGAAITTTSAKGVFTTCQIVRQDPNYFGEAIYGIATKALIGKKSSNADKGTAPPGTEIDESIPRRYTVNSKTYYRDIANLQGTTLNLYWEQTVRPWLTETIRTLFGHSAGVIWESHSEPFDDATEKAIGCQAQVLLVGENKVTEFDETATFLDDRRLIAENVWDGTPDSYDLSEGGRRLELEIEINAERVDNWPDLPGPLGGNWVYLNERRAHKKKIIDPVTGKVTAFRRGVTRRYLYVARTPQARGPVVTGHGGK
jgi:hypothetical protein